MIILGSQSEARFKLLSSCNTEIKVVEANIDEEYDESKSVYENVVNIAKDKADHIIKNYNDVQIQWCCIIVKYYLSQSHIKKHLK